MAITNADTTENKCCKDDVCEDNIGAINVPTLFDIIKAG